jgi:hypothetical protein
MGTLRREVCGSPCRALTVLTAYNLISYEVQAIRLSREGENKMNREG